MAVDWAADAAPAPTVKLAEVPVCVPARHGAHRVQAALRGYAPHTRGAVAARRREQQAGAAGDFAQDAERRAELLLDLRIRHRVEPAMLVAVAADGVTCLRKLAHLHTGEVAGAIELCSRDEEDAAFSGLPEKRQDVREVIERAVIEGKEISGLLVFARQQRIQIPWAIAVFLQ